GVEDQDQRPEDDREQRRDDLADRVVVDVVVVAGDEHPDHQVDDRKQAGAATPVEHRPALPRPAHGNFDRRPGQWTCRFTWARSSGQSKTPRTALTTSFQSCTLLT